MGLSNTLINDLVKFGVTAIHINPFVFEDLKQDEQSSADLMEWFPQGGWTFKNVPIVIDPAVQKWEFKNEKEQEG